MHKVNEIVLVNSEKAQVRRVTYKQAPGENPREVKYLVQFAADGRKEWVDSE